MVMQTSFDATQFKRALLAYFVLFAAFGIAAARMPLREDLLPSFLTAWFGACVGIALVYLLSRVPDKSNTLLGLVLGGLFADGVCNFVVAKAGNNAPESLRLPLIAFGNLGLIAAAVGLGVLVARGLQKPNYLIMAAIVGAVTDIFSVYAGPSKAIIASPSVFPYVSYQWGVIGQGAVISCVGAGDFIFLALYFAGTRRFGLNDRKTFVAMSAAFALGFLSLLFSPRGIPALPFMAIMLLLVHGPALKAQMRAA